MEHRHRAWSMGIGRGGAWSMGTGRGGAWSMGTGGTGSGGAGIYSSAGNCGLLVRVVVVMVANNVLVA